MGNCVCCRSTTVGSEGDHVSGVIVAEGGGLHSRTPLSHLAAAFIVAIAGGVALGIRNGGRLVAAIAVDRGGHVACGIGHHEGAACLICHRGGGIAAAIFLRKHHTIHRVAAGEGGDNSCCVLLRERKAIHRHRLGSDGTGGRRTVLHSFRMFTILRPLGGSQAAFADKNRFRLQRARKLRDELYCTLAFICSLAT